MGEKTEIKDEGLTGDEAKPEETQGPDTQADTKEAETEKTPADKEEKSPLDDILEAELEEGGEQEAEPDETGKVPYSRFSKVYGKSKELERKFDLFKRDPEAYYKLYPDEKPDRDDTGSRGRGDTDRQSVRLDDLDNLTVNGGTYHGMTLAQVRQQDPAAAAQMESAYLRTNLPSIVRSQVQEALKIEQQEAKRSRLLEESQQEIDTFRADRAKEFFKKTPEKLTKEEAAKLDRLIDQTVAWGKKTGRGWGRMEDIYFLMTKDRQLAKAKADGAGALLSAAEKGSKLKSVRTGGGEPAGAGYDRFLEMSDAQAAREFENMPDKEFSKLMKTGSKELRAKYPGWPWE
jgi:hypothetical protein